MSDSAPTIRLLNPADESLVGELPLASRDEADAAIACARRVRGRSGCGSDLQRQRLRVVGLGLDA